MAYCLVTGGAGFIGSHLATTLLERGHQVRVLDNLSTGRRENLGSALGRIDFVEADLCDSSAVQAAAEGVDWIFHEAALASVPRSVERPLETHTACVTGTLNVLIAAQRAGVQRVVYAASSSAYGDQPHASKRESDLPRPLSPYAAAKLAGEYYCQCFHQTYGLEAVALRYFNVFGPRQDPDSPYSAVIPLFVKALREGTAPTIYGDGLQSRDFTYVANVVEANLLAAQAPGVGGRVLNVATGRSFTLLELLDELQRLMGTRVAPIHAPPRVGDVRDSLADITEARRLLGFEPLVDFRTGLERTVEYYRGQ